MVAQRSTWSSRECPTHTDTKRRIHLSLWRSLSHRESEKKQCAPRLEGRWCAKGALLLVEAFGSPQSYSLYTFAKHFPPTDLRLICAGPGTFWTDLKSFRQVGASKV